MAEILINGMTLPEEGETLILAIDSEGNIDQPQRRLVHDIRRILPKI